MAALGRFLRTVEGGLVSFWCPGCKSAHAIKIEGRGAWGYNNNPGSPTFTPSVLVQYFKFSAEGNAMLERGEKPAPGERYPGSDFVCHSFVREGQIQFLSDSSHELAGQTVALPEFP